MKRRQIKVFRESLLTPTWAAARLTPAGGLNFYGEPNYRLVWSDSRLSFVGGKFEDRDEEGRLIREVLALRMMPKYPIFSRWIVEQWISPEKYGTPESWYRATKEWGEEGNIAQLGPYPSRGEYELACVLESGGEFVQLTSTVLDDVILALKLARRKSYADSVRRRKESAEKRKKQDAAFGHEYLNEHAMPAFGAKQFVTVL